MPEHGADAARPTDAAGLLSGLVARTSADGLPASAMAAARLVLLDTVGCALAGAEALGVRKVRELVLEWAGAPLSAVWGTGRAAAPPEAAFANSMSGHALDYDDQHPGICHTGVAVVPAALAVAEARRVDDLRTVLAGIVLGAEVADRIAVAVTDGPGVTGWLLTPLCGYFGAAATAAKVAGLDERAIRHALGFAYVQASGNGQVTLDGAIAKRMQPAFASRGGVLGAELAARGLTGPTDSLEGVRGFFHVYHRDRYDAAKLRDGLGGSWLIEDATYKPYPCCAWTHAALECGAALRAQGIDAARVASVTVGVNAQAYQSTGTPLPRRYRPKSEVDAQFSIPYTFAVAFLAGEVRIRDFSGDALERPEVLELAARVNAQVDPELDKEEGREVSPARAVAILTDGRRVEVVVREPLGRGTRALGRAELLAKFMRCCEHAGRPKDFAERVAAAILDGTATRPLIDALRGEPSAR